MTGFGKLTKRQEFTAARKGRRTRVHACLVQAFARPANPDESAGARFGLTVTKKIGNAPQRNRIKRRLRAAVRAIDADAAEPFSDYVLIANREALHEPFDRLVASLNGALAVTKQRRKAAH